MASPGNPPAAPATEAHTIHRYTSSPSSSFSLSAPLVCLCSPTLRGDTLEPTLAARKYPANSIIQPVASPSFLVRRHRKAAIARTPSSSLANTSVPASLLQLPLSTSSRPPLCHSQTHVCPTSSPRDTNQQQASLPWYPPSSWLRSNPT